MSDNDSKPSNGSELADDAVTSVLEDNEINDQELADALAKLSPEEARMFAQALEMALRRRRMMLLSYLSSLVILIAGMAVAMWVYGTREPGTFVGWVFLVPFAAVGIVLLVAGKVAKRGAPITPAADQEVPEE